MHAFALALLLAAPPDKAPPPSPLDEKIAAALKNHPDIKAAEAKRMLAEAEVEQARLAITQKVSAASSRVELAKAKLIEAEEAAVMYEKILKLSGAVSETEKAKYAKARPALIGAKAELAAAELELQQLVGKGGADTKAMDKPESTKPETVVGKMPSGPVVEKLEAAVAKPVKLELKDTPIADAITAILKSAGADDVTVRSGGMVWQTGNINFKSAGTFPATLQLLIDDFNTINSGRGPFDVYVREYGLLIEKPSDAPKDAVTLSEFIRAVRAKKK